jgi:hypothetical protein
MNFDNLAYLSDPDLLEQTNDSLKSQDQRNKGQKIIPSSKLRRNSSKTSQAEEPRQQPRDNSLNNLLYRQGLNRSNNSTDKRPTSE